jgi:hypothetical protein
LPTPDRAVPPEHLSGPLGRLDFIYTPSADVARDVDYFEQVLGAEIVFAIDGMGTRVAMVRFSLDAPAIMLADHLDGATPVLVYRVDSLTDAMSDLEARGWERGRLLELPPGPACSFTAPGGQRIAIYEPVRSFVVDSFSGRRDFGGAVEGR